LLSFRPDLSWGSFFSELSHALAQQCVRFEALPKLESERHAQRLAASHGGKVPSNLSPLGVFSVSVCVKISVVGSKIEEVWWAPRAQMVTVEALNQSSSKLAKEMALISNT
jgi:hypothetical protein